jgi:DNA polymerase II small subunit/DNA polymerase delta subunit B
MNFLEELKESILNNIKIDIKIIIIPGNHDGDFSSNQTVRNTLIKSVHQGERTEINEELISAIL